MNANTETSEMDGTLTKVDIDDVTDYEWHDVIPSCDFVIVGYDSSYTADDADTSTKRVEDPRNPSDSFTRHTVSGNIVGDEADGDRSIGFSKEIRTSKSSGRIGRVEWVKYPADEPAKTDYTVTFRALAGNWQGAGDPDDPEHVDSLVESTVEKFSYDGLQAPPEDERFVEDVDVGDGTIRRATVDIPVSLTIANADTTDVDDVVERARKSLDNCAGTKKYDRATYREDLPEVGEHIHERSKTMGGDLNLRRAVRYWIIDTDVEAVEH